MQSLQVSAQYVLCVFFHPSAVVASLPLLHYWMGNEALTFLLLAVCKHLVDAAGDSLFPLGSSQAQVALQLGCVI